MEQPLISIIVPVYNAENYLEDCVESLLQQSYKNIEFILVDDGSTDTSAEICDIYSRKDTRVTVIHKENEGQAEARNIGVQYSHGEFIGFADDDDTLEPEMFEILYKNMMEYNAAVVYM